MLNAGGSPETCVYRLRSDGDRVAGRGQACAFGVRLSPMGIVFLPAGQINSSNPLLPHL